MARHEERLQKPFSHRVLVISPREGTSGNHQGLREAPNKMFCPTFGHCPFGGSKRLPRWFGALIKRRTIQPIRMVIYGPKKKCGGGSNRYLGKCRVHERLRFFPNFVKTSFHELRFHDHMSHDANYLDCHICQPV